MLRNKTLGVATFLAVAVGSSVGAWSQTAAEFFKGRTVTITVGFDAGGTYSHYALLIAEHLHNHVPGSPTFVVNHMPGAGGTVAANFAFNAAAKDGSVLLMPPDTVVVSELLQPRGIRYKTAEFQWIGTAVQTNAVVVVRTDTGVKTVADLKAKQVIMSSTGRGSQTFLMPALMNGVLGTQMKIVQGYPGSAKALLAMEQNETQGISLTWGSFKLQKPDWFKDGFARAIVQFGLHKDPDLANVPMGIEFAANDDDRKIIRLLSSLSPVGRGLVAPPGAPKERVDVLRAAFDKMVKDKRFIDEAEKRRLDLSPLTGAELQQALGDAAAITPDLAKRATKAIFGEESGS